MRQIEHLFSVGACFVVLITLPPCRLDGQTADHPAYLVADLTTELTDEGSDPGCFVRGDDLVYFLADHSVGRVLMAVDRNDLRRLSAGSQRGVWRSRRAAAPQP